MKTGAEIIADFGTCVWQEPNNPTERVVRANWPVIKAALLAYKPPKTALRTILDKIEGHERDVWEREYFTRSEIAFARAELDELERK